MQSKSMANLSKPVPISVLIPTLNCARLLPAHIESMRGWLDFVSEIVVVDSHSEDGSLEIIQERIRHPRLRIFQHPRGLYQSWNFGISQITSKYTYISTVGDLITRDGIKHLVETAERLKSDVIVSVPRFVGTEGEDLSSIRWPIHNIVANMQMSTPCVLPSLRVFVLAVDYALKHGLQGIMGSSASNLYRTEMLQRFPFPTEYGSPGDVVWGVRHARDMVFAVTPACFSEFLFHEKEYTLNTRQQNALIMENLAKEARAILIREIEGSTHESQSLAKAVCAILLRETEEGAPEAQSVAREVRAILIHEIENGSLEAQSVAREVRAILIHEIENGSLEAQNLAKELHAILVREIEDGNHEARLFFDWLNALEEYSRARNVLEEYRSRKWPWFLSPEAWRARYRKKMCRKHADLLRRQIEPFFQER
jgi:glycosyltransferase involved in cell wall biosynthesis